MKNFVLDFIRIIFSYVRVRNGVFGNVVIRYGIFIFINGIFFFCFVLIFGFVYRYAIYFFVV